MSTTNGGTHADVLIIGAGPTGGVTAKRLAQAGFEVVCLEQGDWPDHGKARGREADFELTAAKDWSWTPNVRQAPSDYPIEESESEITPLLGNGVGGSTLFYAAHWHRNMPSDFCVRSLDGVADDWPLTYEELEPYYERVERDFAVSGLAGDPAYPDRAKPPLPPSPLGRMGEMVARGHNQLGWHWWPGSNAIATREYGNLKPCVQRGTCMWGCPDGAKASADLTLWPVATELGVKAGHRGEGPATRGRLGWTRNRGDLPGPRGEGTLSRRSGNHTRGQRDRHPPPPAQLGDRRPSRRARQLLWPGRQAPDDASVRLGGGALP